MYLSKYAGISPSDRFSGIIDISVVTGIAPTTSLIAAVFVKTGTIALIGVFAGDGFTSGFAFA